MTDSIRQQIIDKIDTRFKAILTTGGYKTNIGNHVYDWLDRDLADSELPALIYKDRSNAISAVAMANRYENRSVLEIQIKAETASTTAESLREMIEDVYKAIGSDETWSGLAFDTRPVSEEIEIQQESKIIGSATLIIEVQYITAKWSY